MASKARSSASIGAIGRDLFVDIDAAPAVDTWHHIVFVVEADIVRYYANGQYVGATVYTPAETTSTILRLGVSAFGSGYYHGQMDDFRVWLAPLTEDEPSVPTSLEPASPRSLM